MYGQVSNYTKKLYQSSGNLYVFEDYMIYQCCRGKYDQVTIPYSEIQNCILEPHHIYKTLLVTMKQVTDSMPMIHKI
jgi:hypothetical protein